MIYSYNRQIPGPLPFRIKLSDGRTRTDPSTFTEEEIVEAGYVAVDLPPNISSNQVLLWDAPTLSWIVRDKTEGELRAEYIATVPTVVTMRQARLALLQQGLLDAVNSALISMEGTTGEAARIEWEYANEVYRSSQLVTSLAQGLGWSEDTVLELFVLANTL